MCSTKEGDWYVYVAGVFRVLKEPSDQSKLRSIYLAAYRFTLILCLQLLIPTPGSLLDPKAQMTKTWMAKELTGWGTSGNITNN
jgi:hypothetical protein